jgi:hypothetical protein
MRACINIYVYFRINSCVFVCICVRGRVCLFSENRMFVSFIYIYIYIHTYIHTSVCIDVYAGIRACANMVMYVCMYVFVGMCLRKS